jgi:membrane-bound ClpP family serine protease
MEYDLLHFRTRLRLKISLVTFCLGILCFSLSSLFNLVNGEGPYVGVITIDGPIDTVSERYLKRSLTEADENGAKLVVINLDTPGDLLSSSRDMVASILNSNVPIAVFVFPPEREPPPQGLLSPQQLRLLLCPPVPTSVRPPQ